MMLTASETSLFPLKADIASLASANRLLASILPEARDLLPHFYYVEYSFNDTVYESSLVYFPINSVISAVALLEDGTTIEVNMVGREGMAGVSSLFGRYRSRYSTRVSVGGSALTINARLFNEFLQENPSAQTMLLGAYRSLISQISQRSVCNARHSVMERLCCWLLMIHDRIGTDDLRITQESIAMRLGARRAGITNAAGALRSMHAIAYNRGSITIADRHGLERVACECYDIFKEDFEGV
ncbi:MAG: Crp/Fnr family transcriptional regulator [Pyrinomonadaceae bacterium]